MGTLIFNCIGIGFIAGAAIGYFLGYGDGRSAEKEKYSFDKLDSLIRRVGTSGAGLSGNDSDSTKAKDPRLLK